MTPPMGRLVDTILEDEGWQDLNLAEAGEAAGQAVLRHLGLPPEGFEISLMGCNDARIAELNTEFRGKPVPTNVLSWPSDERAAEFEGGVPLLPEPGSKEMPEELGDIAIARETCVREAAEAGISPDDHILHLLVHATLHLLGYDHVSEHDAAIMEAAEVEILAEMGIKNPYEL
jgi:probable rRNA maturation factor